jgi:hypothetical protein
VLPAAHKLVQRLDASAQSSQPAPVRLHVIAAAVVAFAAAATIQPVPSAAAAAAVARGRQERGKRSRQRLFQRVACDAPAAPAPAPAPHSANKLASTVGKGHARCWSVVSELLLLLRLLLVGARHQRGRKCLPLPRHFFSHHGVEVHVPAKGKGAHSSQRTCKGEAFSVW